jgi:hypothetical protein
VRDRVFGIETEYAVIYHPSRAESARALDPSVRGASTRPTNLELYGLFEPRLQARVRTLPRAASLLRAKRGCFLENGGSFHYEGTPQHFEHGLIEMASPECRDPFTLLAHERAKDELVEELARDVTAHLRRLGYAGEVRIGKNNVDSQGHTFGSHESYWVDDPIPPRRRLLLLPLWVAAWTLTLPALLWLGVVTLGLVAGALLVLLLPLVSSVPAALARLVRRSSPEHAAEWRRHARFLRRAPLRLFRWLEAHPGELARRLSWVEAPLHPVIGLHSMLQSRFHFRPFTRALTAFLVSRTLYAGAGSVVLDGGPLLRLAQRPPFLRRLMRIFTSGEDRPVYESRDVFFRPWSAFARRRRLHLMLGDANLCEWAQVLRVGATALVLEAIEADRDGSWPELEDPLAALARLNRDASLSEPLRMRDGRRETAIGIQRAYLARVRSALAREALPPEGWKVTVLEMWEDTLGLLSEDPAALGDRIDWLAKRAQLEREIGVEDGEAVRAAGRALVAAAPSQDSGVRRLRELAFRALRTDLRYHELGPRGGYRRLLARGAVRRIVDDAAVAWARREPPADTRAFARGRAIRDASRRARSGGATWHRVRVGVFGWRFFPDPLDPSTHPDGS